MPRIARIVAPNFPHHITQRGTNRIDVFLNEEDRIYFLQCLNESSAKAGTNIWAYCLMSNHFHLLLEPIGMEDLGQCLHRTTFRYAQFFNQKYGRIGRLWQNRYFSCPVDKDEYLLALVRYIERNPVRAGVTRTAEEWQWSSARAHILGERDGSLNLFPWLNESERETYRRFVMEDGKDEEIRKATSSGKPLGNTSFIEILERISGRRLQPSKRGRPRKN